MNQYNSLNVRLFNSQLNKSKSALRNPTEVILKPSSNMTVNSNYETNFPHKLSLTHWQISKLPKANTNLSKMQMCETVQSGGLLGRLCWPLLNTGLPLMKNVFKLLAKSVLIPLGLTAAVSTTEEVIQRNGKYNRNS